MKKVVMILSTVFLLVSLVACKKIEEKEFSSIEELREYFSDTGLLFPEVPKEYKKPPNQRIVAYTYLPAKYRDYCITMDMEPGEYPTGSQSLLLAFSVDARSLLYEKEAGEGTVIHRAKLAMYNSLLDDESSVFMEKRGITIAGNCAMESGNYDETATSKVVGTAAFVKDDILYVLQFVIEKSSLLGEEELLRSGYDFIETVTGKMLETSGCKTSC